MPKNSLEFLKKKAEFYAKKYRKVADFTYNAYKPVIGIILIFTIYILFVFFKNSTFIDKKLYFINGDPMELIQGATLNSTSFMTTDNYKDFDEYVVITQQTMPYYTRYKNPEKEKEEENSTHRADASVIDNYAKNTFKMTVNPQQDIYTYNSEHGEKDLVFHRIGNTLELKKIGDTEVHVLHYSFNPEKRIFSFLFSFEQFDNGDASLSTLIFKKSRYNKTIARSSTDYRFLFNNLKFRLSDKNISLSPCGDFNKNEIVMIKRSLDEWNQNEAGINLRLDQKETYPPFSDVDINCIVASRKYITGSSTKNNGNSYVPTLIDYREKTLLPSTVFLVLKTTFSFDSIDFEKVLKHEIGHLLGLGHEFRKDKDSITGYAGFEKISEHDKKALKSLYSDEDSVISRPLS